MIYFNSILLFSPASPNLEVFLRSGLKNVSVRFYVLLATCNRRHSRKGSILWCPLWFLFLEKTLDCPVNETDWLGSGELRIAKLCISS